MIFIGSKDLRSTSQAPNRLTPDIICRAYAVGLFPMANSRYGTGYEWISPLQRGIIPLDSFHIPRRLSKIVRQRRFQIKVDTNFESVITECAAPREKNSETWINQEIQKVFGELHKLQLAHSVEAWLNDNMVGGLYGLALGGVFFGESMFSRHANASKVALIYLLALLRKCGFALLDAQFTSSHLRQFGVISVPAAAYLRMLDAAIQMPVVLHCDVASSALSEAVDEALAHSKSHIS